MAKRRGYLPRERNKHAIGCAAKMRTRMAYYKEIKKHKEQREKIMAESKKNYYEIRVYDRCLNLTEVMQNDAMDNLKYGIWKEI